MQSSLNIFEERNNIHDNADSRPYRQEWACRSFSSRFILPNDLFNIIFLIFVMFCFKKYVIDKISLDLLKSSSLTKKEKGMVEQRYKGTFYRFVFYLLSSFMNILFLLGEDWILDPLLHTFDWENKILPKKFRLLYLVELSHYIFSLYLLFYEPKMKDFTEMLIHHIVTISLIIVSFHYNMIRYGIIVMLVHDICDPFLELSKTLHYLKAKFKVFSISFKPDTLLFILFTMTFFTSRIVVYPRYILYPTFVYLREFGWCYLFITCYIFLVILFFINCFWFALILKTAKKFIEKGDVNDVREPNIK